MPKVIYVTADGTRHEVEVENGYSVMEGAINNNIDGIVAEYWHGALKGSRQAPVDSDWAGSFAGRDSRGAGARRPQRQTAYEASNECDHDRGACGAVAEAELPLVAVLRWGWPVIHLRSDGSQIHRRRHNMQCM